MGSTGSLAYPDFLIIGAQKAGTTWLHRNLQAHPGIWMPWEKELHYFDEKIRTKPSLLSKLLGQEPPDRRWRRQVVRRLKYHRQSPSSKNKASSKDHKWDFKYFLKKPNNEWYASLFEEGKGRLTGEATPDYSILDREGVARVYEIMPETRIIYFMRNPIERDWSAVDMGLRLKGRSLERASVAEVQAEFDRPKRRLFSDYRRTLENWGAFYPPEQVFVGFLEDVHFRPEELLGEVYAFLGVDLSATYRVIKRKIHSGDGSAMGTDLASHLAGVYRDELKYLDERFGSYASFWSYCAERLAGDPPEEETIAYPLWESYLWDEWEGVGRTRLQSGPLASFRDV
jgi:hypothetical protein